MTVGQHGPGAAVIPGMGQQVEQHVPVVPNQPVVQNQQKVQKPIKATELKAYLHAWCNKQAVRPNYDYHANGKPPKVGYIWNMYDIKFRTKVQKYVNYLGHILM